MTLYILLSQTGTILSRTIKIFTKYDYNHVSLGFDKNLRILYSFARKNPRNPFFGGFVKEDIKKGLFEIKKDTTCLVLALKISKAQAEKILKIFEAFLSEKEKYKYNIVGLIKNAQGKNQKDKANKYFCSEFAAKVLAESGVWDFEKPYVNVKPQDFLEIRGIKKVYEGKLFEYNFPEK